MITLTAKQAKCWTRLLDNPKFRRVLLTGGARSTKTTVICSWMLQQAYLYPGIPQLIARKYRNAVEKSIWESTLRPLCRGRDDLKMMDSTLELKFNNGSVIYCDGLDDAARVDKVLGREFGNIFINEATEISSDTKDILITRLSWPGNAVRKMIFDCNPKSTRHWLYKMFFKHQGPDDKPLKDAYTYGHMHWTPYDNPALPQDALESLEALTGMQRKRMLDGTWCNAEGTVYGDDFDENVHVISEMPKGWENWEQVRGIDFGYTNPFVCLWGCIDPDGRLYIYHERYVSRCIVSEHAEYIKAQPYREPIWTVADHDAEDRATLAAAGIETVAAHKEVLPGIEAVKARLRIAGDGRPRIYIHRNCVETIGEVYDYSWAPPKSSGPAKEEPLKERDHALDTVRYMVKQIDHGDVWGHSKAII